VRVRSFPFPRLLAESLAATLAVWIFPNDARLLRTLHFWHQHREHIAHAISYALGTWGDYPTYNVPLALAIWGWGAWRRDGRCRRAGIACLLGATLAGGFDDCFRLTLGRPRPDSGVLDGFYGLPAALHGGYQSFPSGHAASVFGAAVALLIVARPLGVVTTIYAVLVVWARMELNRHYPSDVIVGTIIGIYFGAMAGLGARVRPTRAAGPG
jgi:membrane-associated phospholipid phosphatase